MGNGRYRSLNEISIMLAKFSTKQTSLPSHMILAVATDLSGSGCSFTPYTSLHKKVSKRVSVDCLRKWNNKMLIQSPAVAETKGRRPVCIKKSTNFQKPD